ncbi:hypothetical protein FBZ93_102601 [Bradyrhizobium macuxiense]|uniref:Uncharacterized protein n=2 Tax=Bradyrhizobium macuxiense TaxID=1755647 RepID=A0A560MFY7_9BRAD|nr:hypothetical protein FBZ93_102601 [Bradyrhizobium macuxiense]
MISAQPPLAFVARENRFALFRIMLWRNRILEPVVIDPKTLLERAAQLADQAKGEEDAGIRERLLRMAEHYRDLAAHEAWAHENPPSVGALTDALGSRAH